MNSSDDKNGSKQQPLWERLRFLVKERPHVQLGVVEEDLIAAAHGLEYASLRLKEANRSATPSMDDLMRRNQELEKALITIRDECFSGSAYDIAVRALTPSHVEAPQDAKPLGAEVNLSAVASTPFNAAPQEPSKQQIGADSASMAHSNAEPVGAAPTNAEAPQIRLALGPEEAVAGRLERDSADALAPFNAAPDAEVLLGRESSPAAPVAAPPPHVEETKPQCVYRTGCETPNDCREHGYCRSPKNAAPQPQVGARKEGEPRLPADAAPVPSTQGTPRTDALLAAKGMGFLAPPDLVDHARQLERELAALGEDYSVLLTESNRWENLYADEVAARSSTQEPVAYIWHDHLGHETRSLRWSKPSQWDMHSKVTPLYEAPPSATRLTLPEDVLKLLRQIADAGESGEPIENWPKYWPVQDEQGGCVACGAGTITHPAEIAERHLGSCYFRMAYEIVRRSDGGTHG